MTAGELKMATLFRVRWELLGGHVHMRVFAGKGSGTLGLCGNLVMRQEEFEDFRHETYAPGNVEFVEEERDDGHKQADSYGGTA